MNKSIHETMQILYNALGMRTDVPQENRLSWEAETYIRQAIDMLNMSRIFIEDKGLSLMFCVGDRIELRDYRKNLTEVTLYAPIEVDAYGNGAWYAKTDIELDTASIIVDTHMLSRYVKLSPARKFNESVYRIIDTIFYIDFSPEEKEELVDHYWEDIQYAEELGLLNWDTNPEVVFPECCKLTVLGKIVFDYWKVTFFSEE